jgi:membrane protease YdiL (CAAX protease family)
MRELPPEDEEEYPEEDLLPEEFPAAESVEEIYPEEDFYDEDDDEEETSLPIDPGVVFVMLIVVALLGAGSLRPDVRFTLLWTVLAIVGVVAFVMDDLPIERPTIRDLLLGMVYGAIIGIPIVLVTAANLRPISNAIFEGLPDGAAFQTLVFTIPLAETLFFRGVFQEIRGLILATAAGSLWTIVLFFPAMNVLQFPLLAFVLGLAFVFINFVYSYLRQRFGIFAAWTCQIVINLSLLFLSRFAR